MARDDKNTAPDKVILKGEEALFLWRQGKDEWNKWVTENPVADIDFSDEDFAKERTEERPDINFAGFNFPKGDVTFYGASFGEGNVTFDHASFGKGDVTFFGASFGKGYVTFDHAIFGKGDVIFFGASFGEGYVSFNEAEFGEGDVNFWEADFRGGNVGFYGARFGEGDVTFYDADFGEGNVNFGGASFGKGDVTFDHAIFGKGDVTFDHTIFGEGAYIFESIIFKGHLRLIDLKNSDKVRHISFKNSSFERTLDLSGNSFNCVVDLTSTKLANQVSLEGLECNPQFYSKYKIFKQITTVGDISRLRRLKEIAENNKDHERAQAFHADEMRAKRWHDTTGIGELFVDYSYDLLSNYGRSLKRPLISLLLCWFTFSCLYSIFPNDSETTIDAFQQSLIYSASQMFQFIPSAKGAMSSSGTSLFSLGIEWYVYLATFIQSIFSLILLFLVGLALRNRFRI